MLKSLRLLILWKGVANDCVNPSTNTTSLKWRDKKDKPLLEQTLKRLPLLTNQCDLFGCRGVVGTWWRHQMETFSSLLALCDGKPPVIWRWIPLTKPVTRSFDVFYDLRLNKRLSKQSSVFLELIMFVLCEWCFHNCSGRCDLCKLRLNGYHSENIWRDESVHHLSWFYSIAREVQPEVIIYNLFIHVLLIFSSLYHTGCESLVTPAWLPSDYHPPHDDVIKWNNFPRYCPFVRGIHLWPVNSPHKGQWRGALMFSLICVWTNGWVNNRDAHYDVTVIV